MEAHVQCESVSNNGYKDIDRNGDPDWALHSGFRGAEEGLDPQGLLDPLEKEGDVPVCAI